MCVVGGASVGAGSARLLEPNANPKRPQPERAAGDAPQHIAARKPDECKMRRGVRSHFDAAFRAADARIFGAIVAWTDEESHRPARQLPRLQSGEERYRCEYWKSRYAAAGRGYEAEQVRVAGPLPSSRDADE